MARRYSISFDTLDAPGRIKAVWVELGEWYMKDADKARIDLSDHPLYPKLEEYVRNNASAHKKVRVARALADLEEVRKATFGNFGEIGACPNVYADYDRLMILAGKMRRAMEALEKEK